MQITFFSLADLYQHWLPDSVQQKTLRDSGYYSVSLVHTFCIQNQIKINPRLFQILVKDKLRVISINANFCNNFNFWLLLNFNDPHHHLHWLYRQLHKAELKKENVFILGHIAPGTHSCLGKDYFFIKKRENNSSNFIKVVGVMSTTELSKDSITQFLHNFLDTLILTNFKYFSTKLLLSTWPIWHPQKLP